MVCYPAAFDHAWISYYIRHFLKIPSPFGYTAWDIWSLWKGLGEPFPIELDNNHVAVDDARNQGELFFRLFDLMESRP